MIFQFVVATFIVGIVFILVSSYFLYRYFSKKLNQQIIEDRPIQGQVYESPLIDKHSYEFRQFIETSEVELSLKKSIEALQKNDISSLHFIHGTFVGNDPFDVINFLKNLIPFFSEGLRRQLRNQVKKNQSFWAKDMGNFSDQFINELKGYSSSLPIYNFSWSSANHHLARLRAACDLIKHLDAISLDIHSRHFFVGHSHAGQIMAIFTMLLFDSKKRDELLEIADLDIYDEDELLIKIQRLRQKHYIFLTLGTPPRYEWALTKNTQLINLINHRGETELAGNFLGLPFTKDGDYIQQWGIAGSDVSSPLKNERDLNVHLDKILGIGNNLAMWKENIKHRKRVPDYGHTFLIDYKDKTSIPGALKTFFGHGIYTKRHVMPYNLMICLEWLKKQGQIK